MYLQKLRDECDDLRSKLTEAHSERDFVKKQLSNSVPSVSYLFFCKMSTDVSAFFKLCSHSIRVSICPLSWTSPPNEDITSPLRISKGANDL